MTALTTPDPGAVLTDDGRQVLAHVSGEIDTSTCGRRRNAIDPHLVAGQRVVLDLSAVTFMDSAGLHLLEHIRTTLAADGGHLILRNPSRVTTHLLTVTGSLKLFDTDIG